MYIICYYKMFVIEWRVKIVRKRFSFWHSHKISIIIPFILCSAQLPTPRTNSLTDWLIDELLACLPACSSTDSFISYTVHYTYNTAADVVMADYVYTYSCFRFFRFTNLHCKCCMLHLICMYMYININWLFRFETVLWYYAIKMLLFIFVLANWEKYRGSRMGKCNSQEMENRQDGRITFYFIFYGIFFPFTIHFILF